MKKNELLLQRIYDWFDKKKHHMSFYPGVSEIGYDDKSMITANWNNIPDSMQNLIKNKLNIDTQWFDEWSGCHQCNKAIRMICDSYGWEPSFIKDDSSIMCHECAKDDIVEYAYNYINNHNMAIPSWAIQLFKKEGFDCYSTEDDYCKIFHSGWHSHMTDDPKILLDEINELHGKDFLLNRDYVFALNDTSQFYIEWTFLIRKKEITNI